MYQSYTNGNESNEILCAISGVSYRVDHLPASLQLTARETYHPMFDASFKQLERVVSEWADGTLTDTESYLLYLALFNSTKLIQFRVPAIQTGNTASIVAQNLPALYEVVGIIHALGTAVATERFALPHYVVSPETKDLENTKHWIENWQQAHRDYQDAYRSQTDQDILNNLENVLEPVLRDYTKDISKYSAKFAEWAARAGGFTNIDCTTADGQNNDKPILLSEYWKRIIRQCCKKENIFNIHDADLSELIEHCEDTIAVRGSILSYKLMEVLREAQKTKNDFFTLGDIDVGAHGTIYKILDPDSSVEDANKVVLIDTAPEKEPIESQYPNKLAFIKAKMRWQMKVAHEKSDAARAAAEAATGSIITAAIMTKYGEI